MVNPNQNQLLCLKTFICNEINDVFFCLIEQQIKEKKEREAQEKMQQLQKVSLQVSWVGGGGVLPYMGYVHVGMCSPKGYGFLAVLVINRVLIFAYFGQFGHK